MKSSARSTGMGLSSSEIAAQERRLGVVESLDAKAPNILFSEQRVGSTRPRSVRVAGNLVIRLMPVTD